MKINIITDTCGDLTHEMAEEYGIDLVPILVYDDEDNVFEDRFTIQPEEIYREMRAGKMFRTAQVQPIMFQEKFKECAEKGEACLSISFSSGLSGTYQTSMLIKNEILEGYPDAKIEVVDTKCVSLGSGMVAMYASKLRDEGYELEEIVEKIKAYASNIEHIFTVDDLDYLYKGGRLNKASAVVGNLLKVKPILESIDGKLEVTEKERGRKKSLKRLVEKMGEMGKDLDKQTVYIVHADALSDAEDLKQMIEEKYSVKETVIKCLGSAIATHTGPGLAAVVFSKEYIEI